MNYEESLEYIHGIYWRGSKLGLSRTQELLALLGNPEKKLKFIHIAGTNGKGSTAAMLASVLQAAGYRTGLYTSPFINRFNERMCFNGEPITDEELAEVTSDIKPVAESMQDLPTEFELVTAIGFEYFLRKQCDIVVLEVGMGGLLDSTNVIEVPEAAVICAIGLDHTADLGNTFTEIAKNKAGIIKEGGDVIIYGQNPEADAVFEETCREKNARLHRVDYSTLAPGEIDLDGQTFSFGERKDLRIPLVGTYQPMNAALVLTTLDVLKGKGWNISEENIREGLAATKWPGRFEVLQRDPVFIVDGGHNPHGIKATADSLAAHFPNQKIHFLMGVMADKDVSTILDYILPLAADFIAVKPDNPRAMDPELLAEKIREHGVPAKAAPTVADGVAMALAEAAPDEAVCALGSLYMSGEVRACFNKTGLD